MALQSAPQTKIEKRTGNAHLSAVVNAQGSDYSSRAFADAGGVLSRRSVKTHRIHWPIQFELSGGFQVTPRTGAVIATLVRSGS
jgi:hypothetical protein